MKRQFLALAILTFLGAQPLTAAEGQFYLVPGAQWMEFDHETELGSDIGYFLGLGYDITERISAELSIFDLDPDVAIGRDVDLDHYKVDGFYHFDTDWRGLQPFVVTGFGNTNFDGDNDSLWDLGAGVRYQFSDNLYWRAALRGYSYLGREFGEIDVGVDTGLIWYFGRSASRPEPASRPAAPQRQAGVRAEPAPERPVPSRERPQPVTRTETAIADADRDGVADSSDRCPETPRNYAVDEAGCPIPVEEVARVELVVNFDFDRSEVKPQYFDEIEEVTDFMEQYEDVVVELEGHTDSRGTQEYNQGLSERRANAVRQVMIDRFGISAGRITASGFGEAQPVASNDSDAGRAENRRVITVIIKTLQNYQPR